jgi:hypothetical protein
MVDLALVQDAPSKAFRKPRKRQKGWTPRPKLIDRRSLDGRTTSARLYDKLIADVVADLGGLDQIGQIEQGLIIAYVASRLGVESHAAKIVAGAPVDWSEFAGTASTMIRAAARLKPWRRLRDVTPTLSEYVASKRAKEAAEE